MSQMKVPLIVFVSVLLISGLLAFIGGASYFDIVLKAVVSALSAATFIFVAKGLLQRYVPDMFEDGGGLYTADSPSMGNNVDVRIAGGSEVGATSTATGDAPSSKGKSVQTSAPSTDDMAMMEGLGSDALGAEDPLKDVELDEPEFKPMSFAGSKQNRGMEGVPQDDSSQKTDQGQKKTEKENMRSAKQDDATPIAKAEEASKPASSNNDAGNNTPDSSQKKEDESSNSMKAGDSAQGAGVSLSASNTSTSQNALPHSDGASEKSPEEARLSEEEMDMALEKDVDRLEELPDLQEFVSSTEALKQSKAEELMSTGTQSFFETNLSEDAGTDAKLMANAIRTVLKRE